VWVDPEGAQITSIGLSATLRDLGRFGEMLRNDGKVDGRQVLAKPLRVAPRFLSLGKSFEDPRQCRSSVAVRIMPAIAPRPREIALFRRSRSANCKGDGFPRENKRTAVKPIVAEPV
jgi:hypothetical protein